MKSRTMTADEFHAWIASKRKPDQKKRRTKAEWDAKFAAVPTDTRTLAEQAQQRALFERHDAVTYHLRLPLSPTVNNLRASVHGRLITSAAGRAYYAAVERVWRALYNGWPPEPLTGRLRVLILCCLEMAGEIDIENRLKACTDGLTKAGVWHSDSQIDDLRIIRGPVHRPGYLDVTVETIS